MQQVFRVKTRHTTIDVGHYRKTCSCYRFLSGPDPDCMSCDGLGFRLIKKIEPKAEFL